MTVQQQIEGVSLRLFFEDLLYREAWLLDNGKFSEWLDMLDDNLRYRVPVRANIDRSAEDFGASGLMCHMDDDKPGMTLRVKRLEGALGHSDHPTPRMRHFVTNVRVLSFDDNVAELTSNVSVFRSHVGLPDHVLVGCRNDKWKQAGREWQLLERLVVLDQDTIRGMSVLF